MSDRASRITESDAERIARSWWTDLDPALADIPLDTHEFSSGWITRPGGGINGSLVVDRADGSHVWLAPTVFPFQVPAAYQRQRTAANLRDTDT